MTGFADQLGVNRATFFRKMRTGNFGASDIRKIMSTLDIDNPVPIFFAPEVTSKVTEKEEA